MTLRLALPLLALPLLALPLLAPASARAGACCSGSTSNQVGALGPCEAWGVGVAAGPELELGAWDSDGRLRTFAAPRRVTHRAVVFGALRPARWIQLGASLTLLAQVIHRAGTTEVGAGPGDAALWTRLQPFEDIPGAGSAPLPEPGFSIRLPTGIPVDRAPGLLGAGATGTGHLGLGPTLRLGRTLRGGGLFASTSLLGTVPPPAWTGPVPGVAWTASLDGSVFLGRKNTLVVGGGARGLGPGTKDGHSVGGAGVEPWLRAALTSTIRGADRITFALRGSLPAPLLGRRQPATLALSVSIERVQRGALPSPRAARP